MTISFCLPIYNVAKYVTQCIESIEKQNQSSYEIICVNDASTDDTLLKLQNCQSKNDRIKIFNNDKNRGVSYSRNRAIEKASGEYIWFVDPDDLLPDNAVNYLLEQAEKTRADIILGNYVEFEENVNPVYVSKTDNVYIRRVDISKGLDWLKDVNGRCDMMSVWRGVFRKSFITDNHLTFNEKVVRREDVLFYMEIMLKNPMFFKAEFNCYLVRQREGSAMRGAFRGKKLLQINSTLAALDSYKGLYPLIENKKELDKRILFEKKDLAVCLLSVKSFKTTKEKIKLFTKLGYYPINSEKGFYKSKLIFWLRWIYRRIFKNK